MLSERKGKGAFSKIVSFNLGQKNSVLYRAVFIPLPFFCALFHHFSSIPCSLPGPFSSFTSLLFHQPPFLCLLPAPSGWPRWDHLSFSTCNPHPHPEALVAHIGVAVTEEEMRGAETGGNVVLPCPPPPAAGEGQLGGGDLLPPYKSLLGWTSAPGRGRVEPQPSLLFSLPHPPSPHSQQLASSGH